MVVTSLVAYSAFTHICPKDCLTGQDLLQIPLWNSIFFHQPIKSRVQENCFRTFHCPALAARGIQRVADCLTDTGQLNAAILLRISQSYRPLYARLLLQHIDAVHGREPRPQWLALPPLREWKLSGVLKLCRQHLRVKARQPAPMWEALVAQAVPFKLCEFVIMALWRKLPVAQRLAQFKVMEGRDCPLCGVVEHHHHVFKKCFFLRDSLALIRRLWGLHVCDNVWYEPSRLCTDHSFISITTIQGWLVWTVVYARWLIRREAISTLQSDIATTVLQRFYVALLGWKSLPEGLPHEVITTTCECLKDVLKGL